MRFTRATGSRALSGRVSSTERRPIAQALRRCTLSGAPKVGDNGNDMTSQQRVEIWVRRPPGYHDVHPDLFAEDAMREGCSYEVLLDRELEVLVAIDRLEGYERVSKTTVAEESVKTTWLKRWRLA